MTALMLAWSAAAQAQSSVSVTASGPQAKLVKDGIDHILPFSRLLNTSAGQTALWSNLSTALSINNSATSAQQAQAIHDYTIDSNLGTTVVDGLGSGLSQAYFNAIAANAPAIQQGGTLWSLFSNGNDYSGTTASVAKYYFGNGSTNENGATVSYPIPALSTVNGQTNVEGKLFTPDAPLSLDPYGNPRPFQVGPALYGPQSITIFSAPSYVAPLPGQTVTPGPVMSNSDDNAGLAHSPSFPSGHTTYGFTQSLMFAIMVPEAYQTQMARASEYGLSRIIMGAHYPLDVIGGRIVATYTLAQLLDPQNKDFASFQSEFAAATTAFRSLLSANCGGVSISACIASGAADRFSDYATNRADYLYRMTYGLPSTGDTALAPVVPSNAYVLLTTRFPYLSAEQITEILYTTEVASGAALDDGSGWARINLFDAAGGYGAFRTTVTVNMDPSLYNSALYPVDEYPADFFAFDTWTNDITGPGGLIKQGAGTLILSGNTSYLGGTQVQGGTLGVTGSVIGAVDVSAGAAFIVGPNGLVAADDATAAAAMGTAPGTITNAGTLENYGTITGGIVNSGLVTSTGAISGAIANTGTLVSSGTLSGGLVNSGLATLAGTLIGSVDNSNTLETSAAITGDVTNSGTLTNTGSITGSVVNTGLAINNGSIIGAVTNNGTLKGSGSITGGLSILGTVAPGNSIGTLTVSGPVTFGAGSVYEVEIGASGQSDLIAASGPVTISGGSLQVIAGVGATPTLASYTVLTSTSGISGNFTSVNDPFGTAYPFLDLVTAASGNSLTLNVVADAAALVAAGDTPNQAATALAATTLPSSNAALLALVSLNTATAPAALDSLSGQIYASAATVLQEQALYLRDAIGSRLRQQGGTIADALTGPAATPLAPGLSATAWMQGYGAWGNNDGTSNTAGVSSNVGGVFGGIDVPLGDAWRAGIAGGYSQSNFDVDALASSGSSDNYDLAAYAGGKLAGIDLRLGAAYGWHDLSVSRTVSFPGFVNALSSSPKAGTTQLFGEIAKDFALGGATLAPFAGIAYVHFDMDGFTESGGAAALTSSGFTQDNTFTTLGARVAQSVPLGTGLLTGYGSLAWQYAFGDINPEASFAFAAGSTPFTVAGAPLGRNAALVNVGLDYRATANMVLGISYGGQFSGDGAANMLNGRLTISF